MASISLSKAAARLTADNPNALSAVSNAASISAVSSIGRMYIVDCEIETSNFPQLESLWRRFFKSMLSKSVLLRPLSAISPHLPSIISFIYIPKAIIIVKFTDMLLSIGTGKIKITESIGRICFYTKRSINYLTLSG